MAYIAVLTGDLIGSTRVSDPDAYREILRELLSLLTEKFAARTSVFRGDGFQLAVDSGTNIFRMALLLRTGLIARSENEWRWDARMGIAFGKGRLQENDENSEAHVHSGRTLDSIGKENMRVWCPNEAMEMGTGVATEFVDDLLNTMTPVEAQTLFYYLLERGSHQSIADRLGKQRPTITVALQRTKYHLIDRYIQDMDRLAGITYA